MCDQCDTWQDLPGGCTDCKQTKLQKEKEREANANQKSRNNKNRGGTGKGALDECWTCGQKGHKQRDCPLKKAVSDDQETVTISKEALKRLMDKAGGTGIPISMTDLVSATTEKDHPIATPGSVNVVSAQVPTTQTLMKPVVMATTGTTETPTTAQREGSAPSLMKTLPPRSLVPGALPSCLSVGLGGAMHL